MNDSSPEIMNRQSKRLFTLRSLIIISSLMLALWLLYQGTRTASPSQQPALPGTTPEGHDLASIQRAVPFSIFVPTYIPNGWTADAPVLKQDPGGPARVEIIYRNAEGELELTVLNGPAGCCLDADPRKRGEAVSLQDGTAAHFLQIEPEYGGPILWWVREGTYVALSGPQLSREELLKIAQSVSQAA